MLSSIKKNREHYQYIEKNQYIVEGGRLRPFLYFIPYFCLMIILQWYAVDHYETLDFLAFYLHYAPHYPPVMQLLCFILRLGATPYLSILIYNLMVIPAILVIYYYFPKQVVYSGVLVLPCLLFLDIIPCLLGICSFCTKCKKRERLFLLDLFMILIKPYLIVLFFYDFFYILYYRRWKWLLITIGAIAPIFILFFDAQIFSTNMNEITNVLSPLPLGLIAGLTLNPIFIMIGTLLSFFVPFCYIFIQFLKGREYFVLHFYSIVQKGLLCYLAVIPHVQTHHMYHYLSSQSRHSRFQLLFGYILLPLRILPLAFGIISIEFHFIFNLVFIVSFFVLWFLSSRSAKNKFWGTFFY